MKTQTVWSSSLTHLTMRDSKNVSMSSRDSLLKKALEAYHFLCMPISKIYNSLLRLKKF